MALEKPFMFYASLALAAAFFLMYVWWAATHNAWTDPGLVPTVVVFILLGLLGAYAAKLEGEKPKKRAARSDRAGRSER